MMARYPRAGTGNHGSPGRRRVSGGHAEVDHVPAVLDHQSYPLAADVLEQVHAVVLGPAAVGEQPQADVER